MTPDKLANLLTDLDAAAQVVEAIDDAKLQRERGWNLANWKYDLVPWGVRFQGHAAEVVATLAVGPRTQGRPGTVLLVR